MNTNILENITGSVIHDIDINTNDLLLDQNDKIFNFNHLSKTQIKKINQILEKIVLELEELMLDVDIDCIYYENYSDIILKYIIYYEQKYNFYLDEIQSFEKSDYIELYDMHLNDISTYIYRLKLKYNEYLRLKL